MMLDSEAVSGLWRRKIGSWLFATIAALIFVARANAVSACSCADPESPCAAARSDAVIFVGTAVAVEPTVIPERFPTVGPGAALRFVDGPGLRFHFNVDEWIQGGQDATSVLDAKRAAVTTDASGFSCGYSFEIGTSYLVYAFQSKEGLVVSLCSRTGPVSAKKGELALFHEMKNGAPHTTLFGGVYRVHGIAQDSYFDIVASAGMPNVKIAASSTTGTEERLTDEDGDFVFVGIEPGAYQITASLPPDLEMLNGFDGPVTVESCATQIDIAVVSTPLSGTVRNLDGSPVGPNVRVDVVRVDGGLVSQTGSRTTFTLTDSDGAWKFPGLPPGQYRLGLNLEAPATPDSPYERTWYPKAAGAAEALVLDISDDRVTRVQIEAPPRIPEQSVEGIVVDGSGAPVPGAIVSLFDANWKREAIARAQSGSDGRFIVQALQGRQYGIQASTSSRLPGQSNLQEVPSDGTTEPMKLVVQPANR